ncbi:PSP1 C-terminal conserved region [Trypanosoma brucei equiperdum]|uniref:PSP1 C-terminal conserved region n=1 Tax=Trypanosoma brucei equiperdum TaxID=630700 RepID=A0A3L6L0G6_9TRYP|nr:PSP1 C-terminal conserved region [Trypanosoma brucei equiperdum]
MQHQLREEQMRATLKQLQTDVNELLDDQEQYIRFVYGKIRGQLERMHHMIASGGDAATALGNCSSYLGSMDHLTQAYAGCMTDGQRSGAAGGCSLPAASTPLSERIQGMLPPLRNLMMEGLTQTDCTQWAALTTAPGHEDSPTKSPQKQWGDEGQVCSAVNAAVDYTCFDPIGSVGGDDDLQQSAEGSLLSPYACGDDLRHEQLHQGDLIGQGTKADVIHIGTINSLSNQHVTTSVRVEYVNGRPKAVSIPDGAPEDPERLGIDVHSPCKVMVEFKRKRVLQFESKEYVPPGSCVVVGGDRGEDIGLVTYTWCETTRPLSGGVDTSCASDTTNGSVGSKGVVVGVGLAGSAFTRNIGLGSGTVLRLADESDVTQLHTVQVELERRAIDVCSQRVLERGLPMTIVDAEYQFDKNKLTFFYEAEQRMDFRELVRDLYKTFRARIWMEAVEN